MTEIGGKTLQGETITSPDEFERYLKIAREQKVFAFRIGGLAVQFSAEADESFGKPLSDDPNKKTLGGWKRPADLDADPDLETNWD